MEPNGTGDNWVIQEPGDGHFTRTAAIAPPDVSWTFCYA